MSSANIQSRILSNGHDAVVALRERAEHLSSAVRPHVAAGVDRAGETISHLADVASRSVSRAVEDRRDARDRCSAGLSALATVATLPAFARTARRAAVRHPALLAIGGLSLAAIGYLAWRAQRDAQQAVQDDDVSA